MTSVNQSPASKKTSIGNAECLKELEKARLKSSNVECAISFLDCSENSIEIDYDGDSVDAAISKDQMRGIFLTAESIILELKEIKRLVLEHAPNEEENYEIIRMIDDALMIIDLALRMGQIRLSNEVECGDSIGLGAVWVNGFFCSLKYANDRMCWLFTKIDEICVRIQESLKKDIGLNNNSVKNHNQCYESEIKQRVKAIQPKFKTLTNKYHHHEGSELLTNPEAVLKATESLRNEIQELQNKTPKDSEEWTDCRISIEELDFLIRLIKTKFEFRKSDVYALSLIVDQAGDNIERIFDWLTPDDGGDLVDTVH